jgi:DNA repair protein SbcD/Mre11
LPDYVTIVHAADTHIDSPLRGLDRLGSDALAQTLRAATREAFHNLVELVIARAADALVLAGDIYDGDARDYGTAKFFSEQMHRLDQAGIPVVMVTGNHDADSVVTKSLQLPDNVTVLPVTAPGTVVVADKIAFHGQGFATKAVLVNLARNYPQPIPGLVNVGVLHTSVSGYNEHDPYAPCSVDDLKARGYEYFALGHVHQRQVLCQGRTTAAFSGNLQGRHVRETGPKGALVVRLAPGAEAELEFVELDVARWEHLQVDVSSAATLRQALDLLAEAMMWARREAGDRPVVARVTLTGTCGAAPELADIRKLRAETGLVASNYGVAIEKVRNLTRPPDLAVGIPTDQALLRAVASRPLDGATVKAIEQVQAETEPLLRRLGLLEEIEAEDEIEQAHQGLVARMAGGAR